MKAFVWQAYLAVSRHFVMLRLLLHKSIVVQDDYTRCRRVAELPKIRVTSQGGPCQLFTFFI